LIHAEWGESGVNWNNLVPMRGAVSPIPVAAPAIPLAASPYDGTVEVMPD
jgi:hypothetical protein